MTRVASGPPGRLPIPPGEGAPVAVEAGVEHCSVVGWVGVIVAVDTLEAPAGAVVRLSRVGVDTVVPWSVCCVVAVTPLVGVSPVPLVAGRASLVVPVVAAVEGAAAARLVAIGGQPPPAAAPGALWPDGARAAEPTPATVSATSAAEAASCRSALAGGRRRPGSSRPPCALSRPPQAWRDAARTAWRSRRGIRRFA